MARISLREALNNIENLIRAGELDDAQRRCQALIKQFPRSLATYRLLGKAYLLDGQYAGAAEIFLRLLSAAPDDLTANLGLSVVREDEGKLDAASWHMARAWEARPASATLKAEVGRLAGQQMQRAAATGGGQGATAAYPAAGRGQGATSGYPTAGGGQGATSAYPAASGGQGAAAYPAAGGGQGATAAYPAAGSGLGAKVPSPTAGGGQGATSAYPAAGSGQGAKVPSPAAGGGQGATAAYPAAGGGSGATAASSAAAGLSRVALGRLYLQGRCYPQAIAELQAAQVAEPERSDILPLLAEAYAQAGQAEQAAQTCEAALQKLPFSLQANRIAFELAMRAGEPDRALPYRQRLQELDPYWAHVTPAALDAEQVPEHAIMIEVG